MGHGAIMGALRAWVGWSGAVTLALAAAGCGDNTAPKMPPPALSRGPVQPKVTQSGPLPSMQTSVDHSPLVIAAALPAGTVVDARVLVISADGSDSELAAIQQELGYLGTPFDVLIANQAPTLSASQLATGTHGKYNAVILTRGNLVLSNGTSAFTTAEFQTLATYEATFQVRRVSLYTSPDAGYGYSGSVSQDTSATPLVAQCTTAGRTAFPYVNCAQRRDDQRRLRLPGDARPTRPRFRCLTDSSGRVLAATRAYGDGREALSLNFAQSDSLFHTLQLLHGVVSWATRGRVPGRAARVHRRPGRRSLSPRRHLHRRDVPDERERSAGGAGLPERQARPDGHRRDALPLRVQRPGRERQRRADGQGAADRQRLQLDQPHLRPLRPRRSDLQLRARRIPKQHQRVEPVRVASRSRRRTW